MHQRYRQTGQTDSQRSDSIRRTVLKPVAPKTKSSVVRNNKRTKRFITKILQKNNFTGAIATWRDRPEFVFQPLTIGRLPHPFRSNLTPVQNYASNNDSDGNWMEKRNGEVDKFSNCTHDGVRVVYSSGAGNWTVCWLYSYFTESKRYVLKIFYVLFLHTFKVMLLQMLPRWLAERNEIGLFYTVHCSTQFWEVAYCAKILQ